VPKLPTKSGSETVEVELEVRVEVELEVRVEVELEVRVEVELDFWLLPLFGICFPSVSSPIASKKLTLSKSSLNSFGERRFKFLPPTVLFNNSSILLVAVVGSSFSGTFFGSSTGFCDDDPSVVIGVVDAIDKQ
jgi:hypothetical protein